MRSRTARSLYGGTLVGFDLEHRRVPHRYRIAAEPDESRYGNDHELSPS